MTAMYPQTKAHETNPHRHRSHPCRLRPCLLRPALDDHSLLCDRRRARRLRIPPASQQHRLPADQSRIPISWMAASTSLLFLATLPNWPLEAQFPLLSALAIILFAWNGFRAEPATLDRVLPGTAKGIFGLIYVVYPLTLIPLLWKQEDGIALILFLMLCVWAGDIAALYIGRSFGRYKLAPRLSPGKTWEGAIASVIGSVLAAALLVLIGNQLFARGNTILHITEPLRQSLTLAIVLNIAAQVGDLLESAIKRGAGIKARHHAARPRRNPRPYRRTSPRRPCSVVRALNKGLPRPRPLLTHR